MIGQGIPAKDVERIVAGPLNETKALSEARAFLSDATARILVLAGNRGCGETKQLWRSSFLPDRTSNE